MNKLFSLCVMLAAALMGSGCSSFSSAIPVGTARPPIRPENVRLYLDPPPRYEKVALLHANNAWGAPFGEQAMVNTVINRMKAQAAKLGANGIIVSQTDDLIIGALGNGLKSGSAIAIYVP